MIDPKELRSGNLVQGDPLSIPRLGIHSNGWIALTAYGISQIESGHTQVEPIVLSPEILEKCGFVKPEGYTNDYRRIVIGKSLLSLERATTREGHYRVWYDCEFCMFIKMEYLHQLQNLTFALTGQELTPNL